ncbi:MAG: radical SAM protein [Candidatus Omnitrophica bacterium]|nr:radical SAM protein [Candidatus Omnitrophota bacterium]
MNNEFDLIKEGKLCVERSLYQRAEELFKQAIALNSGNSEAYAELGKVYYIQGHFPDCRTHLEKAIQIDGENTCAYFLFAKAYKEEGRFPEALQGFKKAVELNTRQGIVPLETITEQCHRELSALYYRQRDFSAAAEELRKARMCGCPQETYQEQLQQLYRGQIRVLGELNFTGEYEKASDESVRAEEFIGPESPMFYNMVRNEADISSKKIELGGNVRALTVTLTNKCNLACIMCKTHYKPWDLPVKCIEEIVGLFPYLERVMWQGGEVFLYEGFREMLKEAARFPMRQIIATNGILINRELAEILVKSNVELTFSIDGATKEVYEHIRQGARFEQVLASVEWINQMRETYNPTMQTRLNVLVMRSNYHQIEGFLDFAKKYRFTTVFFNSTGEDFQNARENVFCYARDDEVVRYLDTIRNKVACKAKEYGIRLENWLPTPGFLDKAQAETHSSQISSQEKEAVPQEKKNILLCHAPWQRMYVDCGGTVRPDCLCPTDRPIGSITENTFAQLWNGEKMKEYRSKILSNQAEGFCNPDCVFGRVAPVNLKFV